jgi:hypothetical protein
MLQLGPEGACSSSRLLLQLRDSFTSSSRKSLKLGSAVGRPCCVLRVCVFVFCATNKPSLQTWCHASHFSGRDLVKIPDEPCSFCFQLQAADEMEGEPSSGALCKLAP